MVGAGRGRFLGPGGQRVGLGPGRPAPPGHGLRLGELAIELLEGVGLVGQAGVGVDVCGDGDVGVPEKFFHSDERDAGLDEQGRAGVSEIVGAP